MTGTVTIPRVRSFPVPGGLPHHARIAQMNVIRYVWDKDRRDILRKVEIFNPKLDKVVKTISVYDQNPFNHYKFPVVPDSLQNKKYDLNGDGVIDITDAVLLLSNFTALQKPGDQF